MTLSKTQATNSPKAEIAILAGGCFWCMQPAFDKVDGVIATTVGYTGGDTPNPTYEIVSAGGSGYYEAIQVVFDPAKVPFEKILDVFWHNVDPLNGRGQFCDKGPQYRAVIFYGTQAQNKIAQDSQMRIRKLFSEEVVTEILPAKTFYPAEDYHQKYAEKNPLRYKFYRGSCGRDGRLKEVWGKPKGGHSD